MRNRIDILSELKDVAPTTAKAQKQALYAVPAGYFDRLANEVLQKIYQQQPEVIPASSTYKVPAGYFDNLAEGIFQKIKSASVKIENEFQQELAHVAPVLNTISKENMYRVPDGYFESFPQTIASAYNNLENNDSAELDENTSLLSGLGKENVYSVPKEYFQQLTENLLSVIGRKQDILNELNDIAPALNEISREDVYSVPPTYFSELTKNIFSKVNSESSAGDEIYIELEGVAPLLNAIGRQNPYMVPDGYFENVNIPIPQQSKIVPFNSRRAWYKYSVAAAVAGLMIFAGTTWIKGNNSFVKFRQMANTNVQKEIAGIADDEIINYLDHQPVVADFASTGSEDPDPDVNEFIHNASNEEIEQYLKDNADPGENENVIKNI